jgi:dihydrofolate reductase
MELILIAAISENKVIGVDGGLPWKIKEDMKRFKELTTYHPVIMGRKTYESIPQKFRPLPNRHNIVLSRQSDYQDDNIRVAHSLDEAINVCRIEQLYGIDYNKAFVIGGESVYNDALPLAKNLEITHVHKKVEGDAFFPKIEHSVWKEIRREDKRDYSFVSYQRRTF